jgi:5-methylcytosine-specific restriction protein A
MPKRPTQHRASGWKPHQPAQVDAQRGGGTKRGYGYAWQKFRDRWLKEHPLCAYCLRTNRTTTATLVDHIIPHRGDMELFWRDGNHQSLCDSCHSSIKQREEKRKPI